MHKSIKYTWPKDIRQKTEYKNIYYQEEFWRIKLKYNRHYKQTSFISSWKLKAYRRKIPLLIFLAHLQSKEAGRPSMELHSQFTNIILLKQHTATKANTNTRPTLHLKHAHSNIDGKYTVWIRTRPEITHSIWNIHKQILKAWA